MANEFERTNNLLGGANHRARVAGSSFTVFLWNGHRIAFARQVTTQSPTPVGPGVVPIHPLDEPYPVELITPQAATMGSVTFEMYELFGQNIWERLAGLGTSNGHGLVDIVAVFRRVANLEHPLRVVKVIKPPRIRGKNMKPYSEEYNNCVVASVEDGETIEIGTMEVLKRVTINYTHITRGGRNNMLKSFGNLGTPSGITLRDANTNNFG